MLVEEASNNQIAEEEQEGSNALIHMPASCHSILKVITVFIISSGGGVAPLPLWRVGVHPPSGT